MAAESLSRDALMRYINGIEAGDEEIIKEAQRESARLAKRANVRMSALEEKGYKRGAYNRAKFQLEQDLNRSKFSESKKLTGEDLMDQLDILSSFLNDDSSLVSKQRAAYESATLEGLEKAGILFDEPTKSTKRELFKFLSSDIFKEVKSQYIGTQGGTGGYLRAAVDAIENGAKYRDLEKLYSDFKDSTKKDISSAEVLDEWLEL